MDLGNLGGPSFDPFADEDEPKKTSKKKKNAKEEAEDDLSGEKASLVHIRVQQRNGKKCITTVQGLDKELDLKKILKALKKAECCNGTVVEDDEMGHVLQLQGDQREACQKFLVDNGVCTRHGSTCSRVRGDLRRSPLLTLLSVSCERVRQKSSSRPRSRSMEQAKRACSSALELPSAAHRVPTALRIRRCRVFRVGWSATARTSRDTCIIPAGARMRGRQGARPSESWSLSTGTFVSSTLTLARSGRIRPRPSSPRHVAHGHGRSPQTLQPDSNSAQTGP
jgi:translation initiation factor 1